MAAYDGQQNQITINALKEAEKIPLQIIFRKEGQLIPSVVNNTRYVRQ